MDQGLAYVCTVKSEELSYSCVAFEKVSGASFGGCCLVGKACEAHTRAATRLWERASGVGCLLPSLRTPR
jgi:hypothetical protein